MKTKNILLVLLAMFVTITNVAIGQNKKETTKQSVVFNVAMDCHSCQQKIEKNIAFEKGVKAMDVSLEKQTVAITFDTKKTDVAKLQQAFKKIGYEAVLPDKAPTKQ
ncbi:hypothetical protein SDC9_115263 [bioreactor metagenome]|uniref:HMA domain-containing protein n=1 Tax=bioreactor metagenome TaxID=1076179 RepID=A0A645BUN3_9ZZZZ|nr:heavy metal-associated domain-containing protein [Paludibacter sp.]